MAPSSLDISVFLWVVLSLTPRSMKHPFYAKVFPVFEDLEGLLSKSPVSLAPGLWEVLRSSSPPTISFLKRLPVYSPRFYKHWGVYLHVLEKDGDHRPKIYIGSGTSKQGVGARLNQYKNGHWIPFYVQRAQKKGYKISFTGLLCWAPVPSASTRVMYRGLFLLLEAAFTLHLHAMRSRDKDYGMPHLCPWSAESRNYDGLCSHTSL
jgi:hypothetical protein